MMNGGACAVSSNKQDKPFVMIMDCSWNGVCIEVDRQGILQNAWKTGRYGSGSFSSIL